MTQRRNRRSVLAACAVVVAVAAPLVSCGSDDQGGAEKAQKSAAPAVRFDGTYSVFRTTATVDREPPTGADAQPESSTWVVQSSCGDGGACSAVARSTTPDTSSGLNLDRMDFEYVDGSWSLVSVPPARSCVLPGTTTPVDEPWVAMDSVSLTPSANADGPVFTLSGPTSSIQGGSCSEVRAGRITLTRKGDLPADTTPLERAASSDATGRPQGAAFRGAYQQRTTVASWSPPALISRPTTQTTQISATPTCTRDGARCVVVLLDKPSQPGQTVVAYADNAFTQTETLPERQCPGRPERYRPTLTSRTTVNAGAENPIASMDSESTLTWSGACAGTVRFESTLTRTGD